MKIYTKVFLVLLVLLIYSCNNDDNGVSEADRAEALLEFSVGFQDGFVREFLHEFLQWTCIVLTGRITLF